MSKHGRLDAESAPAPDLHRKLVASEDVYGELFNEPCEYLHVWEGLAIRLV